MRIALLNQFYAPDISPTAQLAAGLAEHRAARGDHVTVVTGRAGYLEGLSPSPGTSAGSPVRVRRVWTPDLGKSTVARRLGGYATYLAGALLRAVTLPRQDVVVAMTTPPYVVVVALVHKLLHPRTRVVLWSMDCYPDAAERLGEIRPGGTVARILRAVNRWAFGRVDRFVALDPAMAELLRGDLDPSRPAGDVTVVPNWERADLFPPGPAPQRWAGYDELDTEGRTVVVYLGNTGYGHRFDAVLDAAGELGDEALFLFVGGGARWAEIDDAARARGLTNVVLRGYVPKEETAAVMAEADAALITLDDRALGIMSPSKLHANLAAGLPILYVGPAGSNVDEAIARFGCGTSLRNGDAAGLVEAVRGLGADAERRAALRKAARHAFDEAYCDERALPRLDVVIDGAAGQP
ncbi:MAG: glycosyltransferase family 4 protein [Acidimicrobiia bacterium]